MFPGASADTEFIRLTLDHQVRPFECEDDQEDKDLKEFLFEDSFHYLKQLLAVTYIIQDADNTIAYFSVSNDKISLDEATSKNFWKRHVAKALHFEKRGMSSFPAVKIGRLSVNCQYQGKGIGKAIIDWVKHNFTHENKTGCLFIVVDAINRAQTIGFYEKCGFEFLNPNDSSDKTRLMYYCLLEEEHD